MTDSSDNVPRLSNISLGPEKRAASLYTEFEIAGRQLSFNALGARSCAVVSHEVDDRRGALAYNLTCGLTWFETDHDVLKAGFTPGGTNRIGTRRLR